MYGAAVPPPANSSMHPSMEYNMTNVPVAIPQFEYPGAVVNGPSMDMVMMGQPNPGGLPMVHHPPQTFSQQGYNQQYTSQTYASNTTPSYSTHPAYISMPQPHPSFDPMMSSSQYISPMQPQSHQVRFFFKLNGGKLNKLQS